VILGHQLRLDPAKLGRGLEALLSVQVRPHRRELIGPFVERITALPESRALFHLTGPDDYLVQVAVADTADLQRLVLDEFTSRPEVARVETRLIFQQWDCGPLLPPGVPPGNGRQLPGQGRHVADQGRQVSDHGRQVSDHG
jgi:DNA-binding Lrp family transcriptional regulator